MWNCRPIKKRDRCKVVLPKILKLPQVDPTVKKERSQRDEPHILPAKDSRC